MANFLIIGASSGIGRQLALQLSESGHQVFGTYLQTKVSDSPSIQYHQLNVLDGELSFQFLPQTIDGLIYCPGTINLKPFERLKISDFEDDYKLQIIGFVKVMQAVLPKLKKSTNASVLVYSTVAVQTGLPFHTQVSATKGAIEGLTKALAAEFAPKIRVNCIAPSLTDTPLAQQFLNSDQKREANALRHPLKKIGSVQDIANISEFLVTDKSQWVTGQIFHVDGGMSTLKV